MINLHIDNNLNTTSWLATSFIYKWNINMKLKNIKKKRIMSHMSNSFSGQKQRKKQYVKKDLKILKQINMSFTVR